MQHTTTWVKHLRTPRNTNQWNGRTWLGSALGKCNTCSQQPGNEWPFNYKGGIDGTSHVNYKGGTSHVTYKGGTSHVNYKGGIDGTSHVIVWYVKQWSFQFRGGISCTSHVINLCVLNSPWKVLFMHALWITPEKINHARTCKRSGSPLEDNILARICTHSGSPL